MSRNRFTSSQQGGVIWSLVVLLFLLALCAVVYFARQPIMRLAAESWIVDEAPQNSDAIVVMSDDNFHADRATRAAELFRQGIAPVVVASGRRLRPVAGLSELMEHDLIERGVPKDKIVLFPNDAESTIRQVSLIQHFAVERHWKKIILVTSNYNTRRARYVAQKVAPAGLTTTIVSARDTDFDPERWWEKRAAIKAFFGEIVGFADAVWELRGTR